MKMGIVILDRDIMKAIKPEASHLKLILKNYINSIRIIFMKIQTF